MTLLTLVLSTLMFYFSIANLAAQKYKMSCTYLQLITIFIFALLKYHFGNFMVYAMLVLLIIITYKYSSHKLYDVCSILVGYGLMILVDYSIVLFILNVLHLSVDMIYTNGYYHIVITIIAICTYIITAIIGHLLRTHLLPVTDKLSRSVLLCIALELGLCIIMCIYLFSYGEQLGYTSQMLTVNGILFFFLLSISAIIITIMIRTILKDEKLKNFANQYVILEEHSKKLEEANLALRSFKHDYLSIITSMNGYLNNEDYDALKQYFTENILPLNEELQKYDTRLSTLHHINQPEVKSLLLNKIVYGQHQGLDYYLNIPEIVHQFPIKSVDLLRVLGIYLNNANEAALESEEKRVELSITDNNSTITIVVRNSYHTKPDMQHLSDLNYTTKGNGHGYGLYNANQILANYQTVIAETECKESFFTQTLFFMCT